MGDSHLSSNIKGKTETETISNIASVAVYESITIGSSVVSDDSGNLIFKDINLGTKTLTELYSDNGNAAINTPDLTGTSYTVVASDYTVLIDDSDAVGTVFVYIPSPEDKRLLNIVKIGSSQTVRLVGSISGQSYVDINTQYNSYSMHSTNSGWYII